jgi:hypothetical protein
VNFTPQITQTRPNQKNKNSKSRVGSSVCIANATQINHSFKVEFGLSESSEFYPPNHPNPKIIKKQINQK